MKTRFIIYLSITLIVLSSLTLYTSYLFESKLDWGSFFINLTTEIVGILFAILLAKTIIENYEKKRWKLLDERLNLNLKYLINNNLNYLLFIFNYDPNLEVDFFEFNKPEVKNEIFELVKKFNKQKIIEKILNNEIPAFSEHISITIQTINRYFNHATEIITNYNIRLLPEHYSLMIDIQSFLQSFHILIISYDEIIHKNYLGFGEKTKLKVINNILEIGEKLLNQSISLYRQLNKTQSK